MPSQSEATALVTNKLTELIAMTTSVFETARTEMNNALEVRNRLVSMKQEIESGANIERTRELLDEMSELISKMKR